MPTLWQKVKKKDPLLFEKECLPTGDIVPWVNAKHDIAPVQIEKSYIDNIVAQFKKFKAVGIRVPLFKSHIEDADNDRGTIEDVYAKNNSKGHYALFAKIKFHDVNAAKQGTKVDVSVNCPEKFRDGKGNIYINALRHIALTSYPVVPALENWSGPLLCSFDTPSGLMLAAEPNDAENTPPFKRGKESNMSELIDSILEQLGLTAPEGSDDVAKLRIIAQDVGVGEEEKEEAEEEVESGALNLAFPSVLFNQFRKARESEIDGLVRETILTPARAAVWKKKYCTPEAIKAELKLSHKAGADDSGETEFDRMVEEARAIHKDRPIAPTGRSVRLSHDKDETVSPVLAAVRKLKPSPAK